MTKYPRIGETKVIVPRWNGKELFPFQNWSNKPLEWWDAYQQIKHNRYSNINEATYENAVTCLAAQFVLLLYLYEISGHSCKVNDSLYFACEYCPQAFYARKPKELPDFEKQS